MSLFPTYRTDAKPAFSWKVEVKPRSECNFLEITASSKKDAFSRIFSFPMHKITLDELIELHRAKNDTGIVCKRKSILFHAALPVIEINGFTYDFSEIKFESKDTIIGLVSNIRFSYHNSFKPHISLHNRGCENPSLQKTKNFEKLEIVQLSCTNSNGIVVTENLGERIAEEWIEIVEDYPMRKVSREELIQLRISMVPGVVYKNHSDFYYTKIPADLNLNAHTDATLSVHRCAKDCSRVCRGCPRTRDLTVNFQRSEGKTFCEAVRDSWRLEKYDFVVEGIEAFNMKCDAFRVLECTSYHVRDKSKTKTTRSRTDLVVNLAGLFYDDFDGDYSEIKRRRQSSSSFRNDPYI